MHIPVRPSPRIVPVSGYAAARHLHRIYRSDQDLGDDCVGVRTALVHWKRNFAMPFFKKEYQIQSE